MLKQIKTKVTLNTDIETACRKYWETQGAKFNQRQHTKHIKNWAGDTYSERVRNAGGNFVTSHADLGHGAGGCIVNRLWVKPIKKDNTPDTRPVILFQVSLDIYSNR